MSQKAAMHVLLLPGEFEFIYQNVVPFRKSACVYGKMLYKYRDLVYFTGILPSAPSFNSLFWPHTCKISYCTAIFCPLQKLIIE